MHLILLMSLLDNVTLKVSPGSQSARLKNNNVTYFPRRLCNHVTHCKIRSLVLPFFGALPFLVIVVFIFSQLDLGVLSWSWDCGMVRRQLFDICWIFHCLNRSVWPSEVHRRLCRRNCCAPD